MTQEVVATKFDCSNGCCRTTTNENESNPARGKQEMPQESSSLDTLPLHKGANYDTMKFNLESGA
jgi:hypothetical protein